jgi:hypothetical protein
VTTQDVQMQPMPLNTPVVYTTQFAKVTSVRTSDAVVEVEYRHPETDEVILKVEMNAETSSMTLQMIDKVYWHITIDGRPATESELVRMFGRSVSLNISPETRTVNFGNNS